MSDVLLLLLQALLAYVTLHNPEEISEREVEAQLQKLLTSYMMPRVAIIDNMPLLVNGKIDRQFLLKKYESDYRQSKNNNVSIFRPQMEI